MLLPAVWNFRITQGCSGLVTCCPASRWPSRFTAEHERVKKSASVPDEQNSQPALTIPNTGPSVPSPLNEMDQLVSGLRLLEILWDRATRPSLRWLRTQQKRRAIPYIQIGRRIWFCPRQVMNQLQTHKQTHANPRGRRLALPPTGARLGGANADEQKPQAIS
jgi:hypothetical protein